MWLNYIWESSIHYGSLTAMFTPLRSSTNRKAWLYWIKVSTMKNTIGPCTPVIVWSWSIHCPSLSAMFDSLHSSTNQELPEEHLCNHGSHYDNMDDFSLRKHNQRRIHENPMKISRNFKFHWSLPFSWYFHRTNQWNTHENFMKSLFI